MKKHFFSVLKEWFFDNDLHSHFSHVVKKSILKKGASLSSKKKKKKDNNFRKKNFFL
jgi:hypothetical protein